MFAATIRQYIESQESKDFPFDPSEITAKGTSLGLVRPPYKHLTCKAEHRFYIKKLSNNHMIGSIIYILGTMGAYRIMITPAHDVINHCGEANPI
jgi:hypothetical protein